MRELSYLNKYLWQYKHYLLGGIFFIAIANLFAIIPAWLVRETFDMVLSNVDMHLMLQVFPSELLRTTFVKPLFLYGALIVVLALLRGCFMFLMRQTIIVMSRHIEYKLRNEIYNHYTIPSPKLLPKAKNRRSPCTYLRRCTPSTYVPRPWPNVRHQSGNTFTNPTSSYVFD